MDESEIRIKKANEKIAFDNTVKFLADMVRKYSDSISPVTHKDIIECFTRTQNKKTA